MAGATFSSPAGVKGILMYVGNTLMPLNAVRLAHFAGMCMFVLLPTVDLADFAAAAVTEQAERTAAPVDRNVFKQVSSDAAKLMERGKSKEAVALYEDLVARLEAESGGDSPMLTAAKNGLAQAYAQAGELEKAKALFEWVLHVREKSLGDDHPVTNSTRDKLVAVLRDMGAYEEARAKALPGGVPEQNASGQAAQERKCVQTPAAGRKTPQPVHAAAAYSGPKIELLRITLEGFASPPPRFNFDASKKPSFSESAFSLAKAVNLKDVEKRVGKLSAKQRRFLETERFLLLPKNEYNVFSGNFKDSDPEKRFNDEMLINFDNIGGAKDLEFRKPGNCVFIGPDIFMHALHRYVDQRIKILEQGRLTYILHSFLTGLYENIVNLRAIAPPDADKDWERLQAQILVPLLLLQNSVSPNGIEIKQSDMSIIDMIFEDDATPGDSQKKAAALLAPHKQSFSNVTVHAVEEELRRSYAAAEDAVSPLGLTPAGGSGTVAYSRFAPRGYYTQNSVIRAYFRAMTRLNSLGWDTNSPQGCADMLNFALAMSFERPPTQKAQRPSLSQVWRQLMEIGSFVGGYPDRACYLDLPDFLSRHVGIFALSPASCLDKELLEAISNNRHKLAASPPPFSSGPAHAGVFCIFPPRTSLPGILAGILTRQGGTARSQLPEAFSSLWVPAVLGNNYALRLVEQQVSLSYSAVPTASAEGGPLAEGRLVLPAPDTAKNSAAHLRKRINGIAGMLKHNSESDWFASYSSAWLRVLSTINGEYGQGYPLYMRSSAFQAKQMESLLGSYVELLDELVIYEKPHLAEAGDEDIRIKPPPVPKGFIEPNIPFWVELLRMVLYLEYGFVKYDFFPEDREEFGVLSRFKKQIIFCAGLAEKELSGRRLTDAEYEAVRTLNLQYMTDPKEAGGPGLDLEDTLSERIVDVQRFSKTGKPDILSGVAGSATTGILYEALAEPQIMLVLVGNDNTPRVVVGMAYNHQEFITEYRGFVLNDKLWKKRFFINYDERSEASLPPKNFWYAPLIP
jgi:hypothetical protein